jgi:hypothetical protein
MKTIRLLAVVLGMLGVLACSWIGPLDSPAAEQIDAGLKRALVTYAAVRTIGGVLSVVQATQIGGVGATLSPFQFLAPANEMIKQLADVMLLACVAFGVQKILITISGYWAISMVLTAVIVAWVLCQYRWGRSPRWLSGALVFVLLLRFAIPVSTLGTHLISQQFLAKEFNAANAEIISTAETANQIKPPEPTAGDGKSRLPQMSGWVPSVTDIKGSLSKIHHAIDRAVEHLITQIAVFLTETVILPLLLLWTIIRIARLVVARACLVPELKA